MTVATFLPAKDCGNWLIPGKLHGTYSMKRTLFESCIFCPRSAKCAKALLHVRGHSSVTVLGNGASQGFTACDDIQHGGGIPYADASQKTDKFYWGSLPQNDFRDEMKPFGPSNFHMGIVKEGPKGAWNCAGLSANPLFKIEIALNSWNWFTVTFNPGSSRIVVEGHSNVNCVADYTGTNTPSQRTYEYPWFQARWQVYIDIKSVDAVINLKVTWDKKDKTHWNLSHDIDGRALQGTVVLYHFRDDWRSRFAGLEDNFTSSFEIFEDALAKDLSDQSKLFLPGKGVLFFKNATFNTEGDLLVEVKFDGSTTDLP